MNLHDALAANVHRLSAVLVFRVPAAGLQLLIKDRKLVVYSKADSKIVRWAAVEQRYVDEDIFNGQHSRKPLLAACGKS